MTRTIRRTVEHVSRHEKGIQAPVRTLNLGRGSCRDLAMLMIAALRLRGIARGSYPDMCIWPMTTTTALPAATPTPGSGLRSGSRLGRLRSVGRHRGKSKPHPRQQSGAPPARSDPSARHMVWDRVGSSGRESRSRRSLQRPTRRLRLQEHWDDEVGFRALRRHQDQSAPGETQEPFCRL